MIPKAVSWDDLLLYSGYVAFWHIADLQRQPGLGPLTGALPTFGAEGLLSGRNPTVF